MHMYVEVYKENLLCNSRETKSINRTVLVNMKDT